MNFGDAHEVSTYAEDHKCLSLIAAAFDSPALSYGIRTALGGGMGHVHADDVLWFPGAGTKSDMEALDKDYSAVAGMMFHFTLAGSFSTWLCSVSEISPRTVHFNIQPPT